MKRKDFIKGAGAAAASLAIFPTGSLLALTVEPKIRLAMIGVELRGQGHLDLLLRRDDVELAAICDIDERMLTSSKEMINKADRKIPDIFTGDLYAWKKMLEKKGIEAVIIATPWEWHKEMIIGSLEAGIKYVGTEVMLGITLQDHWDVVKANEKYNGHVMMLENVCYRRDVMAILNMVRQNLFGELIHWQGGYQHDLREVNIEGKSKKHEWDAEKQWLDKYDHPLWAKFSKDAEGAGHGGMDFFVIHSFIESAKRKTATQMDVYDAAAWSAITPMSEQSVELGNQTIEFPDFTGGQWMYRKPVFALSDDY